MITKLIDDIKSNATVANSFTYPKLQPHLKAVSTDEIVKCIGTLEYKRLEAYVEADEDVKQVIDFIKDAEVNLALYYYLQVGQIQITLGGVSVIVPKGQQDASDKDLRDALRYHKKRGYKALDKALLLMEETEDKFTDWKASKQYTKFKDILVNSTVDFQAHYNIFNSRQTFISLLSEIKTVELQFIVPSITNATLQLLKTSNSVDKIFTDVKDLISSAIVLFTVSKTLGSGLYYQSATGFELRFDVLDYERNFSNSKELSKHITVQKKQKEIEALQILKTAITTIKATPILFEYVVPEVITRSHFIKGTSIVGL